MFSIKKAFNKIVLTIILAAIPMGSMGAGTDVFTPASVRTNDASATGTLTAVNSAVTVSTNGAGTVVFSLSGTSVQGVIPEGSVDGTIYLPVSSTSISGGPVTQLLSSTGAWSASVAGLSKFRLRTSSLTSGSFTATVRSSVASTNITCVSGCIPTSYVATTTAGTNIVQTGTVSNPVISTTLSPSFTSLTDSGIVAGNCIGAGVSGLFVGTGFSCGTITAATFVAPAVNGSVVITTANPVTYLKYTPLVVTDGVTSINGYVNISVTSATSFTLIETAVTQGVVGNTLALNSEIVNGNVAVGSVYTAGNGLTLTSNAFSLTTPVTLANGGTGATSLASGCLQSNGTVITSVGSSCGTVTSVTGSGNIASSGGVTPNVTITNSPTFTGQTVIGTSSSASTGSTVGIIAVGNPQGLTYLGSMAPAVTVSGVGANQLFIGGSATSTLLALDPSGNVGILGALHATSFFGSGANITSGTIPNAALVTLPLTSNTAGSNITVTGSAPSQTIATVTNPTFVGTTLSGLTAGQCVTTTTGGLLTTTGSACNSGTVTSVTGSGNVSSSGGTTPNVTVTNAPTFTGLVTGTANPFSFMGGVVNTQSNASYGWGNTSTTAGSNHKTTLGSYGIAISGVGGIGSGPTASCYELADDGGPSLYSMDCVGNIGVLGNLTTTTGTLSAANIKDTALTSGNCVQATTGGLLTTIGAPCGSGTVTSVTAGNANIVIGGTATAPTVALAAAPTISGANITTGTIPNAALTTLPLTSITAGTNMTVTGVAPTQTVATVTNPTFTGNVSAGNLTDSALASGFCVQTSTGGLLSVTATPCSSGSGTVTSVTGSGNIASSGGTAPNITLSNSPTITGIMTTTSNLFGFMGGTLNTQSNATYAWGNTSTTAGAVHRTTLGSAGGAISGVGGTGSGPTASCYELADDGAAYLYSMDCVGNIGVLGSLTTSAGTLSGANIKDTALTSGNCLQASTGGLLTTTASACNLGTVTSVTAGNANIVIGGTATAPTVALAAAPTISGANITTATIPNASLVTTPLTSVVGGSNITVTGTAPTQTVSVVSSPTFTSATVTSLTDSGLTPNSCVQAGAGGLLGAGFSTTPCVVSVTNTASFVAPAVGSTVTFVSTGYADLQPGVSLDILGNSGGVQLRGHVTANSGSSITFQADRYVLGASGTTVAIGAYMYPGAFNYVAGTNLTLDPSTNTFATVSSPSFAGSVLLGTSSANTQVLLGSASSQITNQNANTPLAIQFANTNSATGSTFIGSNSANVVLTVPATAVSIGNYGGANLLSLDGTGNLGITGVSHSANWYSGTSGVATATIGQWGINSGGFTSATMNAQNAGSLSVGGIATSCTVYCVLTNTGVPLVALDTSGNVAYSGNTRAPKFYANSNISNSAQNINTGTQGVATYGLAMGSTVGGVTKGETILNTDNTLSTSGVSSSTLGVYDLNAGSNLLSLNSFGDMAVKGILRSGGPPGSNSYGGSGSASPTALQFGNSYSTTSYTNLGTVSAAVASITGTIFGIGNNNVANLLTLDATGNLGINGEYISGIPSGGAPNYLWYDSVGTTNSEFGSFVANPNINSASIACSIWCVVRLTAPSQGYITTNMSLDTAGNLGIRGAFYSSTGTIQTSLRKVKNNIKDNSEKDALSIIRDTKIVQYCYKVEKCNPGQEKHIGFIADDTNTLIAPNHSGEDIGGTAALALNGVQINDRRITLLENNHDKKMITIKSSDSISLELQILWLKVIVGILSVVVVISGFLIAKLFKKLV